MRLPVADESQVVLIGTHACADQELPAVPSIRRNLQGLRNALCDPEVGGFLTERCATFEQPERADGLDEKVAALGKRARDTFLVYYSGHAMLDDRDADSLLLTLADSRSDSLPYSFLGINGLRRAISDSPADVKILILDCCYSGSAIPRFLGARSGSHALASHANVKGAYILTSSAANQRSLAPAGHTYTVFTGALIEVLRNGIPDRHEFIDLHRLYRHLELALAGPHPKPAQLNIGSVGDLALVRNRAYRLTAESQQSNDAIYISLFEDVVDAGRGLEERIDTIDTITRRAATDEAYLRTLRMITEAVEVPALLRMNVAWRLDELGDETGAVNCLDLLTGRDDGASALDRLRALMTIRDSDQGWPHGLGEDWHLSSRQFARMSDEELWGQFMAMALVATGMPFDAMLAAVDELVAVGESPAAKLILYGLMRRAGLSFEHESRTRALLEDLPIRK